MEVWIQPVPGPILGLFTRKGGREEGSGGGGFGSTTGDKLVTPP